MRLIARKVSPSSRISCAGSERTSPGSITSPGVKAATLRAQLAQRADQQAIDDEPADPRRGDPHQQRQQQRDDQRRGDRRAADAACAAAARRCRGRSGSSPRRSSGPRRRSSLERQRRRHRPASLAKPVRPAGRACRAARGTRAGKRRARSARCVPRDRQHQSLGPGRSRARDRPRSARRDRRDAGSAAPHSSRPRAIDDREARAVGDLLREHALRARAARSRRADRRRARSAPRAARSCRRSARSRSSARFRWPRRAAARAPRHRRSRSSAASRTIAISASGSNAALRIRNSFAPVGQRDRSGALRPRAIDTAVSGRRGYRDVGYRRTVIRDPSGSRQVELPSRSSISSGTLPRPSSDRPSAAPLPCRDPCSGTFVGLASFCAVVCPCHWPEFDACPLETAAFDTRSNLLAS